MTTTHPDLTVTITPDATVFEGLANVRRYDHPSPADIAAYIRSVIGPFPDGTQVHVEAGGDDFARVSEALADYDIVLTRGPREDGDGPSGEGRHALKEPAEPAEAAEPAEPAEPADWWDDEPIQVERPSADGAARLHRAWIVGACVVAVALAIAAAIWATMAALGDGAGEALPEAPTSAASPSEAVTSAPTSAPAEPESAPAGVVIVREGLMVRVPAGFEVEPDGDMWRATGDDPDFRLQLAVDPLYQLPPEELTAQLLRDMDGDPQVELVHNDGRALTYKETGADGSEALWRTWAEGGHHISVGCHTRTAPNQVQSATCRMAMDSAAFDADHADG